VDENRFLAVLDTFTRGGGSRHLKYRHRARCAMMLPSPPAARTHRDKDPAMRLLVPARVAAVAAVVLGVLIAPPPAGAATHTPLASGVRLNHATFTAGGHRQSVYWVTVQLSAHARIRVTTPRHLMGAKPMTTLALAKQEHAIAGLNGDTFYFDKSPKGSAYKPTLGPRGGVVSNGVLLKAPLENQDAIFYLTKDGRAHIGPVGFTGTLQAPTGGEKKIASVNSIESAWNGNIMLTDSRQLDHALPSCAVALLTPTGAPDHYRVTSLHAHVTTYRRISSGHRALVTCRNSSSSRDNVAYLAANLHPGHTVLTLTAGLRTRGVTQLVSGVHQLVRNGKPYRDTAARKALNEYGDQQMPETFVCVAKNRTTVSLGVFEGHKPGAAGVTYKQETAWLVRRGCWEAMAVDGSTSSTLVAQKPHSALHVVNRPTASDYPGGQRPQTDGIFIVTN
jgi:phosphodiester glycosidase